MLTISQVRSSAKATRYLCDDNYYTRDDGVENSFWQGKGSDALGLSGKIDPGDFEKLLRGQVGKQRLGNVKKGVLRHRAGWDLTLSAPKSVSILSEVYGDKAVNDAHHKAVKVAMSFVEKSLIEARLFTQGKTQANGTGNAVIASFTHDVSRALDPQLHTHNIVINATNCGDRWRSVSPEKLYDFQKDIGRVYRSELGRELISLGYTLNHNAADKTLFEISGFDEVLLKSFSQRAEQIERFFKDNGLDYDTTLAKQIALTTREKKQHIDREILQKIWRDRLAESGFSRDKIQINKRDIKPLAAKTAVNRAIKHLSEREMSFSLERLKKEAYRLGFGGVSYVDVFDEIKHQIDAQKITAWDVDKDLWTTPQNKKIEAKLIQLLAENRSTQSPLLTEKKLGRLLSKYSLNEQQHEAVRAALSSVDRFFAIQGDAGVGKTHTLNVLKELADRAGYKVLAMASTHQAVGELSDSLKINGVTVDHYLHNPKLQDEVSKQSQALWIVDESSMLGTEKINELLQHAQAQDARVVMVGDHNQLESVDAGRGFYQLLNHGVDRADITKRMRQQDENLDHVVDSLLKKDYTGAIELLNQAGHVVEGEEQGAIASLVDHWFSLDEKEREKTTIVAPANDQHIAINELIREQRLKRGELSARHKMYCSFQDKYMTQVEKKLGTSYQVGDVIRFTQGASKTLRQQKVEAGVYYEVLGINAQTNVIALRDKVHRKTVFVDPSDERLTPNAFSVYQTRDIALSKGDRIRYMDTDKTLSLRRNEPLTVDNVSADKIRAKRSNGKYIEIPLTASRNGLHIKYDYAKTSYGVQGITTKNVLALMQSWRKNTTNAKSFMVAATRATHSVTVFTDDKSALVRHLQDRGGENTRSLTEREEKGLRQDYQRENVKRRTSLV